MVSRFVLKLIYHNSWFGQFFDFKISIKSSTKDIFCLLESLVGGILQKLSIGLKETLIQRADWFTYFAKKKQVFGATENKSRWLFLKNNLVLKNNVESVRSYVYEL